MVHAASVRDLRLLSAAAFEPETVDAYLRARNERHLEAVIYPVRLTKPNLTEQTEAMAQPSWHVFQEAFAHSAHQRGLKDSLF
jgi:hypothetical protein